MQLRLSAPAETYIFRNPSGSSKAAALSYEFEKEEKKNSSRLERDKLSA